MSTQQTTSSQVDRVPIKIRYGIYVLATFVLLGFLIAGIITWDDYTQYFLIIGNITGLAGFGVVLAHKPTPEKDGE